MREAFMSVYANRKADCARAFVAGALEASARHISACQPAERSRAGALRACTASTPFDRGRAGRDITAHDCRFDTANSTILPRWPRRHDIAKWMSSATQINERGMPYSAELLIRGNISRQEAYRERFSD